MPTILKLLGTSKYIPYKTQPWELPRYSNGWGWIVVGHVDVVGTRKAASSSTRSRAAIQQKQTSISETAPRLAPIFPFHGYFKMLVVSAFCLFVFSRYEFPVPHENAKHGERKHTATISAARRYIEIGTFPD